MTPMTGSFWIQVVWVTIALARIQWFKVKSNHNRCITQKDSLTCPHLNSGALCTKISKTLVHFPQVVLPKILDLCQIAGEAYSLWQGVYWTTSTQVQQTCRNKGYNMRAFSIMSLIQNLNPLSLSNLISSRMTHNSSNPLLAIAWF